MKKNIIFYLAIALVFTGCSDEFTEEPAVGALSDESLLNTTGVNLQLVGAYSLLDGWADGTDNNLVSADNWWADVLSDDAHKGSTDGDVAFLFDAEVGNWETSNSLFFNKWRSLYAGVNRANGVIDLIRKVEGEDLTQQLAEARFLRAHYYFELQRFFGNPSYVSEENFANVEFNQPNTGPVWSEIESDMQFALDNLATESGAIGVPNKNVAIAYMGKIKMYQQKFSEALPLLESVITSGDYSLEPEYFDNFRLAGESGVETIFAVQHFADAGQSFNGSANNLSHPQGGPYGSCCGFYMPTQDLVNAFKTENGLPMFDTFNDSDVVSDLGLLDDDAFTPSTEELDPRVDFTVGRRGIDFNGWGPMPGASWVRPSASDISGPYLSKKNAYYAGEDSQRGTGGWGQQRSGINAHVIRFADVLLMSAEAAVETGDLAKALTYVNQIRERAKNSTYIKDADGNDAANYSIELYTSFPNAAYAREAVRWERRLEFGMEGQRLFDLRRWGNSIEVINEYIANEGRTISTWNAKVKPYPAHYTLFPIPTQAIDLSGNVLTQNPGY